MSEWVGASVMTLSFLYAMVNHRFIPLDVPCHLDFCSLEQVCVKIMVEVLISVLCKSFVA